MKNLKLSSELHELEKKSSGLAYASVYAFSHVCLILCVILLIPHPGETWDGLTFMKILVTGQFALNLFILLPISSLLVDSESTPTGMRYRGHKVDKPNSFVETMIFPLALYITSVALFHFISILFGAPVFRELENTCHFAALLSTTAVLPVITVLRCSFDEWVRVILHNDVKNAVEFLIRTTFICSIIGAWLGAFPIPLDWDRPWQIWPISCVIGNVLGFSSGLLFSVTYIQYLKLCLGKKTS